MTVKTLLNLGRISNLPTVWTNILAAVVLAQFSLLAALGETAAENVSLLPVNWAGTDSSPVMWFGTFLSLSMMYVGGMFLNDAFDAKWDKKNNPTRPIAAGEISEKTVWLSGSALIVFAVLMIGFQHQYYFTLSLSSEVSVIRPGTLESYYGWIAAVLLAFTITAYNALHKQFSHSAFIMGGCRAGVYVIGALLLVQLTSHVVLAALSLLLYIAGLTYLARQEHLNRVSGMWPLALLFSPVFVAVWFGHSSLYFWLYLLGFGIWVSSRLYLIFGDEQPNVKRCIQGLLAAVPLVDGLMLASVNAYIPGLICFFVFLALPKLQEWVGAT